MEFEKGVSDLALYLPAPERIVWKGGRIITNDGYFDNALDIYNSITRRKHAVQEQLRQLACDIAKTPNVPCCLLRTELDILQQYTDALERELWHMRGEPSELESTYVGMISSDWKERLKAEWAQLCIRMERLDTFRDGFREDAIDFVPKWDERLLCDQLRAMRNYRDCLLQYAKFEGVELDMSLYNDSYRYDYYFRKEDRNGI